MAPLRRPQDAAEPPQPSRTRQSGLAPAIPIDVTPRSDRASPVGVLARMASGPKNQVALRMPAGNYRVGDGMTESTKSAEEQIARLSRAYEDLRGQMAKVIVGQHDVIEHL